MASPLMMSLTTNSLTSSATNPYIGPAYQQQLGALQSGYGELAASAGAGYQGLYDAGMADAAAFGRTDRQQIMNAYQQRGEQQQQGLVSRGLGNSTVADSVRSGLLQHRQLDLTASAEAAARQRLGVRQALGIPSVQGPAQIRLEGLSAQQQLGQHYLGLLGQLSTQTQVQTQRYQPFYEPTVSYFGRSGAVSEHPTAYAGDQPSYLDPNYGVSSGGGAPSRPAFAPAPSGAAPDSAGFGAGFSPEAVVGAAAARTGEPMTTTYNAFGGYGDAGGYGEGVLS